MKLKNLFMILTAVVLLTACESREDVFKHRNGTPVVRLSTTSEFVDAANVIDVKMRLGDQKKVYYQIEDDNLKNLEQPFKMSYTAQFTDTVIVDEALANNIKNNLVVSFADNQIVLTSSTNKKQRLGSDIKYTVTLTCADAYNVETKAVINLMVTENKAPKIALKYEIADIDDIIGGTTYFDGWGYKISLFNSVDPDGDEIVAYEYAFDANLETAAMSDNYDVDATKGASGGTYIHATTLNEVYHVFQSSGSHKISVRAKDSLGLWSAWQTTDIHLTGL